MTEETRDIEPYDLFASLMVWIPAIWSGLKATWRHRDWYTGRARHTMRHLGTGRGQWAADVVWRLRLERETPLRLDRRATVSRYLSILEEPTGTLVVL